MGRHREASRDLMRQLEELLARVDKLETELKETKEAHRIEVSKLNNRIVGLESENERLRKDNDRMKRQLSNNSSNSSLPPSTNRQARRANKFNSRTKSDKPVGAQVGHKGKTLTKEDAVELIATGEFKHTIISVGDETAHYVSKYVIDLKTIPVITEHRFYHEQGINPSIPSELRSNVTYGNTVRAIAVDLYAEGAVSNDRICEFINAISGNKLNISTGSIYHFCKQFANKCEGEIDLITNKLLNSDVALTDATHIKNNGKQAYIRNQSTNEWVLYTGFESKRKDELAERGIFSNFTGTFVHDHETALYNFGTGNAECNVHLIRYLKKNDEEAKNSWSSEMRTLMSEMNRMRKQHIEKKTRFTISEISDYEQAFDELLIMGRNQNKSTKNLLAKTEEKKLLNRLEKYKGNHLLFLHDFSVPFDNNLSERDLRKCKTKTKVSGGFRKSSGVEMYCTIMSVIQSAKRQGKSLFTSINNVLNNVPVFD